LILDDYWAPVVSNTTGAAPIFYMSRAGAGHTQHIIVEEMKEVLSIVVYWRFINTNARE
jgi:hypothetical protein